MAHAGPSVKVRAAYTVFVSYYIIVLSVSRIIIHLIVNVVVRAARAGACRRKAF